MVQQARLLWTAAGGAGGVSVLHFQDDTTPELVVERLNAFTLALLPALSNTTTVAPDTVLRQMVTATGVTTGESSLSGGITRTGTGGPSSVPNPVQGLIRLRTGVFVNGRKLQGRIYVPGMTAAVQLATGEMNSTGVNALQAAANALDLGGDFSIWHRPVNGAGGSLAPVNTSSVWTEFAVQRRRRS